MRPAGSYLRISHLYYRFCHLAQICRSRGEFRNDVGICSACAICTGRSLVWVFIYKSEEILSAWTYGAIIQHSYKMDSLNTWNCFPTKKKKKWLNWMPKEIPLVITFHCPTKYTLTSEPFCKLINHCSEISNETAMTSMDGQPQVEPGGNTRGDWKQRMNDGARNMLRTGSDSSKGRHIDYQEWENQRTFILCCRNTSYSSHPETRFSVDGTLMVTSSGDRITGGFSFVGLCEWESGDVQAGGWVISDRFQFQSQFWRFSVKDRESGGCFQARFDLVWGQKDKSTQFCQFAILSDWRRFFRQIEYSFVARDEEGKKYPSSLRGSTLGKRGKRCKTTEMCNI